MSRLHSAMAQQVTPVRQDILEKLTYHQLERDDMTLDDCLAYLQTGGWHKVRGRTEREMVLQLTELFAAAPAAQPLPEPESFEQWNAKQHGDPEEIGFLQALRIAYLSGQDSMSHQVSAAVLHERERCAKVCEEHWEIDGTATAKEFAEHVRSRGNHG